MKNSETDGVFAFFGSGEELPTLQTPSYIGLAVR